MKRPRALRPLLAWLALAVGPASSAVAADLKVFAAASLADALAEVAPLFQAATGHTLRPNFGASGTLTRQILAGAPADVVIAADEPRLDELAQAGLLLPGTRKTILANTLVLVVAADRGATVATLTDLTRADIRRLGIGEPASVPVGTYTQQHLLRLGLWQSLRTKIVPLANARAVLAAVAAGNVEAGFVYRTDALSSPHVRIAVMVPPNEGPAIRYPAAALKDAKSPTAARALVDFLAGPEARAVFARLGFLLPD